MLCKGKCLLNMLCDALCFAVSTVIGYMITLLPLLYHTWLLWLHSFLVTVMCGCTTTVWIKEVLYNLVTRPILGHLKGWCRYRERQIDGGITLSPPTEVMIDTFTTYLPFKTQPFSSHRLLNTELPSRTLDPLTVFSFILFSLSF